MPRKRYGRQNDPVFQADVRRRYEVGERSRDLAQEYGCSEATVLRALVSAGGAPRRAGGHSVLAHREARLRELAGRGLSTTQIAEAFGDVSAEAVRQAMIRLGLDRLPVGALPGDRNQSWKGGTTTDKHGYRLVLAPDHPHANSGGYVREHRLVMERALGRPLRRREVVHHLDGDRANNDPSNLAVYASNGAHLAATLKGQVPNWTPEGKERIREGARASRRRRRRRDP